MLVMMWHILFICYLTLFSKADSEPHCEEGESCGVEDTVDLAACDTNPIETVKLTHLCQCADAESVQGFGQKWKGENWIQVGDMPIEVFSAFLDLRDWKEPPGVAKPPNTATIRIIAHGLQAAYRDVPPVYCHLELEQKLVYLGVGSYVRIYESTAIHDEYTAHFILCHVPTSVPTPAITVVAVSRVPCPEAKEGLVMLPVNPFLTPLIPNEGSNGPLKLGVCVSPIYDFNALHMAEFVELYRLLGVETFTFYLYRQKPEVTQLLEHYRSIGIATLVRWPIKTRHEYFYFDQRSALNDCLYRNHGKVTFAAFVDLDEFLVPRKQNSLPELLQYLLSQPENDQLASVCFQHVFFEKNGSDTTSNYEPPFVTQTRFSRSRDVYPEGKIRSKCMHAPSRLVTTDIHFAQWWLNKSMKELVLPENLAILQHYRPYRLERMAKEPEKFPFLNDYFLLRYRPALTDRVQRMLREARIQP